MNNFDFDFVFAYQESVDCKLITSKHRLINFFIDKEYKILYIEVPVFFPIWIFKKFTNLILYKSHKYKYSASWSIIQDNEKKRKV